MPRRDSSTAIALRSSTSSTFADLRQREGIDAGPETGAAWLALRELQSRGAITDGETVVVFNTGGNKYR